VNESTRSFFVAALELLMLVVMLAIIAYCHDLTLR